MEEKNISNSINGKASKISNIPEDIKNVSSGVSSVGSAIKGEYKDLDNESKKEADESVGKAVKSTLKYIPETKAIAEGIDKIEKVPVIGNVVNTLERSVGRNVNKTVSRVGKSLGNIPVIGNGVRNITGGVLKGTGNLVNRASGGNNSNMSPEIIEQRLNEYKAQSRQERDKIASKNIVGKINIPTKIPGVKGVSNKLKMKIALYAGLAVLGLLFIGFIVSVISWKKCQLVPSSPDCSIEAVESSQEIEKTEYDEQMKADLIKYDAPS